MIIETNKLTKQFGRVAAVNDVSFQVEAGEVVGFVGANGAGKTTTISALLGFIYPTSGSIRLFDTPVSAHSSRRLHRKIGYAAGDMELPPRLTGMQYLRFVMGQSGGADTAVFDDLCRRFKPELHKKISTLSRGNKQKIALIGAFVCQPELIILDEPTSGLDPVMQAVFLELVREVSAAGATVFMSSHYLNEVADVCTRVILMREGRVIKDISSAEMLASSGKFVRIVTGSKMTRPPEGATGIETERKDDQLVLSFVFKGEAAAMQRWVASLKQLHDIEITEYDLEGAFKELYESEGGAA